MKKKISLLIIVFVKLFCKVKAIERPDNYGKDGVAAIFVYSDRQTVAIECEENVSLSKVSEEMKLPIKLQPKYMELQNCIPSAEPFAASLAKLNITPVEKLVIHSLAEYQLNSTHLEGLLIEILKIDISRDIEGPNLGPTSDFLKPLHTLTELDVADMMLPPLPITTNLRKVALHNGISISNFGGCSKIEELDINQWEVLENGWLMNCLNLKTMKLTGLSIYVIQRIIFGVTSLHVLSIHESDLECLKKKNMCYKIFANMTNLEVLDLSNNDIQSIEISNFEYLTSLQDLNLSGNKMTSIAEILLIVPGLPNLEKLTLSRNNFGYWCGFFIAGLRKLNVKHLVLSDTGSTNTCVRYMAGHNMEYLDLTSNKIEVLNFNELLSLRVLPFTVDLRKNPLQEFVLQPDDYYEFYSYQYQYQVIAANLTVVLDPTEIKCDCQHKWLARTLQDLSYVNVDGLQCSNGYSLDTIPISEVDCEKTQCWPGCICRQWYNNTIDANCTTSNSIPQVLNLRKLHAHGARIQTIFVHDFPLTLEYIDLSNNRLSHVDADAAQALFSRPTRKVFLAGNPITCDCNNSVFIDTVQKHHYMVIDYLDMMCTGNERAIGDVEISYLCKLESKQAWLTAALATIGTLAVLIVGAILFYQNYRREIRILLHKWGWFPWLFLDENDDDRPYDVFISFAHSDEEFVVDVIMPKLEGEPHEYSVCVHFRDWIAGEWIPTQIARSVQLSRRTLVVMSSSFLDSMWGLLEFRTAMMCSARDGQHRVIIMLMDEELTKDSRLDPELRAYLSTNTYLCWGDNWFWDKLYYALPHRRKLEYLNSNSTSLEYLASASTDVELIELCSRNTNSIHI